MDGGGGRDEGLTGVVRLVEEGGRLGGVVQAFLGLSMEGE